MLKINNTSHNFDGVSEINGEVVVTMNGSLSSSNFYVNINGNDVLAAKTSKDAIIADITDFIETILE